MQNRQRLSILLSFFFALLFTSAQAQTKQPDWTKLEEETMKHFQAILKINSSVATGTEAPVVDYLNPDFAVEKNKTVCRIFEYGTLLYR